MGRGVIRLFTSFFLVFALLSSASCLSQKMQYDLATGRETLPDWRIISKAREHYGPYIKWKLALIKELTENSSVISTDKGPVEYTIDGGSGPYLMIMHGGPGGYDQTGALFSDMHAGGFRIISWSRPGYLRTPVEDGRTFEEQADIAAALMDSLGIRKAAVLGYSAGGPVAVYFAVRHPDRIWGLILECAVTRKWEVNPDNFQEKMFFGYLMYSDPFLWASDVTGRIAPRLVGMSTIEMESSLDRKEAGRLMESIMHDPRRVRVLSDMVKSMSPEELRRQGMGNDVEQLGKIRELPLAGVRVPTLIIHGTKDADVPAADAVFASKMIPGSELYLVNGGFHVMILSDSIDEITGRRVAFLRKHAPGNEPQTR